MSGQAIGAALAIKVPMAVMGFEDAANYATLLGYGREMDQS